MFVEGLVPQRNVLFKNKIQGNYKKTLFVLCLDKNNSQIFIYYFSFTSKLLNATRPLTKKLKNMYFEHTFFSEVFATKKTP